MAVDFRGVSDLYNIEEAEVLIRKVVFRLTLGNNRVIQSHGTGSRFIENTHFEGPDMLELLMKSDRRADVVLDLTLLLEDKNCLIIGSELTWTKPDFNRFELSRD